MELLTTEGTLCAVKVACTVWDEGKPGDGIKGLPIIIRYRDQPVHRAVDVVSEGAGLMPVNTEGFAELVGQIEKMAHRLNTDEEGAPTAKRILQAAAQPIHQQMKANASHDPKIITGKLHGAINIGKVKRRRNGGQNITIGVHRKDWDDPEYVPAYVEYGHGGPAPAPAHPYIRPAYDTRQNEAYGIIRDGLLNEIIK